VSKKTDHLFVSEQTGLNNYLHLLLNNTEEIYILLNTDCVVLYTNPETAGRTKFLAGMEVKAGVNILDVVAPERRRVLEEMYRRVFAGETVHKEYDIIKNDTRIFFEIQYKPIFNENKQVIAALVTGRDITHKKTAEAELIEREERWRFAMDVSNQGLWDWNILTGAVFYSNSWKKLLGFSQNEISNHINEWRNRLHPDDTRQVEADIQKHLQSQSAFYETTYRLKAKDGTYRWIHARGLLIEKTPDGKPARMIGTHLDITENKQHDDQYKELFDSNPLPTWIYDEDGKILLVNNAAIEHYGYSKEAFLSNTVQFIHPEDQWEKLKDRRKRERQEKKLSEPVWIHRKKSGERIYVSLNSTSIMYNNRTARLVVAHDITEKVKTEKQLKTSNERFRLAAKATSEVLWEWNIEEDRIYLSPVYEDMFGFKTDSLP
jgi:PAS domain S-box-containing protein